MDENYVLNQQFLRHVHQFNESTAQFLPCASHVVTCLMQMIVMCVACYNMFDEDDSQLAGCRNDVRRTCS